MRKMCCITVTAIPFWRWRIGAESVEKLFRFQKGKGAPTGLCVSPGGRFLSYYKYRADEKRLFLYDLETGENRDLHMSIFHYGWLGEEHVVWTRMGGLKALDVKSGTNRTLLRDHKTILKRCDRDDAARISCFLQAESVFENLDLLGSYGGRLWFHFALRSFPREEPGLLGLLKKKREPLLHEGVWSVGPDGKEPRFHYQVPEDCHRGYFIRLFRQGSLCWIGGDDVFQCWDGTDRRMFPAGWKPVF